MDILVDQFIEAAVVAMVKLGDLLREQKDAFPSVEVRDKAMILDRDLRILVHAVFDGHHVNMPNPQAWFNSIGELAYDVEGWVELFTIRLAPSPSRIGCGGHKLTTTLPARHIIVSELQDLIERVAELSPQKILSIPSVPVAQADEPVDPRLATARFVDVGCVVGFDGPIEEVTKLVTGAGSKAQLKVVSIVGMAGSGKTTLAAAVYRQFTQHNCFQFHAFVSVGQKPDAAKKALQDMLLELDHGHPQEPFEDKLIPRLREILGNKSCLIVVDDLWSMEDWKLITRCFPEDSVAGSRIITTTTNLELAEKCCRGLRDCIYSIGLLNEVDSKKLILDTAFGNGHGCPKHLEDVLAQITRRCNGLPLALVTVPSMLEDKSSKDEWDRLIGSKWLSRSDANVMKQILDRSYNDLSQDLKTCLLVLSIFPEDFKVDVDRLIRRCIVEGCKRTDRTYINELICRNMVQPLNLVYGAPRCFRLHPVIHDFVVCKSMELNFVTRVDDQNPPISSNCNVYSRLSVQSSKHDPMTSSDHMDLSHVRSITVFGQASAAPRLTNLCVVRVLDLEGCVGPVCLDNLDKLPLLRYLSLKGIDVTELPATIWKLRFLESLDVRSTMVTQLPPSIVGLRHSLQDLFFGHEGMINSVETATRITEDIQHCHLLENIATVDLREHPATILKALGDLKYLRMLEITWSFQQCTDGAYQKALRSSMKKWRELRSLTINCGLGCSMEFLHCVSDPPFRLEKLKVTAGGFVCVPRWMKELCYLSFLQITACKIETDDLDLLRRLPKLQCFILGLDFVPRNAIVIESEGFSELLTFSVNFPVPWLTFRSGSMPKLTHLQLEFCSGSTNGESVPSGITSLQRLTEVVLLYNQKWCADSSSVIMTVDAMKRQVAKHRNRIDLIINGTKAVVQKVDEEMKSTSKIQSGDAGEEIGRTTVETTQGEIEIEAECDDIGSTC